MEQLLEDCFLAPIGDQGPSLLLGAADAPSMQGPVTVITIREADAKQVVMSIENPHPASEEAKPSSESDPPRAESSSVAREDEPAKKPRRGRAARPKPTRKIHERLQQFRRRRASDNLFLGIPRQQYLSLVEWTARQIGAKAFEPPPDHCDSLLRKWGVEPSHWCHVVAHFGELFHRAVGHLDRLVPIVQRAGGRWLQGSRACRDVFT
jgi:hypothetical protein